MSVMMCGKMVIDLTAYLAKIRLLKKLTVWLMSLECKIKNTR